MPRISPARFSSRSSARFTAAALAVVVAMQPAAVSFAEDVEPFALALAAYKDRKLDKSFVYARQAVKQHPEHVDALALLGELYYLKQDLPEARKHWERALKLAPSRQDVRERLEQMKKESVLEKDLARNDTYPFVVRFSEEQMTVDLGDLKYLLRETYRLIGQQFDYFPNHPITVILYAEAAFDQMRGVSHQAAGLYDGKMRLPIPKNRRGQPIPASMQLKRVLWHEYTHAVVHDLSKGSCPVWLNEGLATVQESRVCRIQTAEFTQAWKKGALFPWGTFWDQPYEQSNLALQYEEAYMIAGYLVKRWGWQRVISLLRRLGQGYSMEDAMRAEFKEEPSSTERDWHSWLRRNL